MKAPDTSEIARYMGVKGTPDEQTAALIARCASEVAQAADPRSVTLELPLAVEGPLVSIGPLRVVSGNLAVHLSGCCRAVLMAATLGAGVDRLAARISLTDSAAGYGMQAAAASLIEQVCDEAEEGIRQCAERAGQSVRSRFSPGYGDFDLEHQTHILRLLDAGRKIGLGETAAHMLTPLKSVTAVIGIGFGQGEQGRPCADCSKADCTYRKETTT